MRVVGLLLFIVLAACSQHLIPQEDQVLAKVNGEPVLAQEFLMNYRQLKAEQDDIAQTNPKVVEQLKIRALNDVIVTALIRQEATRRKLFVAREEVEARLSSWKDGYPPGGFESMLRKQNTTEAYLRKRIEDQLMIEKVVDGVFSTESLVSDEEAKKYYQTHADDFSQAERVHAFQIVVPTIEEANKIRQDILSGKMTFESAARQYSLSPDAAKGGDLGFFSKGDKIATFDEAFSLSVGSISKPIQSRYGIHLLRTVEKEPSKKLDYNQAKSEVVKVLKRSKQVIAYKEWATKLLRDGEIFRNEAFFNSLS